MDMMDAPEFDPAVRRGEFLSRREAIRAEGGFESLLASPEDPKEGPPRHSAADGHRATTVTQWMFIWSLVVAGAGIAAIYLMGVLA